MSRFAISEYAQRAARIDVDAGSRRLAGASSSGRVLDEVTQLSRPGRRRRSWEWACHRTLLLTAIGTLVLVLAGQSVVQAAAAGVSSGTYAHPCPKCHLTQGFTPGAHNGIDLAAPIGTPIYAAAAGTVTAAGPRDPAGFGQVVYIDNNDGTVAWYGHIDTWLVRVGDHVDAGEQIATVGNRGNATGPHLHFEIHAPNPINPIPWLRQRGVAI